MKRVRIGTKNYYQVHQSQSVVNKFHEKHEDGSLCVGCVCFPTSKQEPCPSNQKGALRCCENGIDWIFIPATKQGLVNFAIHRLEAAS